MNNWLRRIIVGIGGIAGWLFTLITGVLVAASADISPDAVLWGSFAGALGWGSSALYLTNHQIQVTPGKEWHPVLKQVYRKLYVPGFYLARSFYLTLLIGFGFVVLFALISFLRESSSAVAEFLNVAPPHVSGNVIAATAVVLAAMLTIIGTRWVEGHRGAREAARARQAEYYPRLVRFLFSVEGRPATQVLQDAALSQLQREGLEVASHAVLAELADIMDLLKESAAESPTAAVDSEDYVDYVQALIRAIRRDLGLRDPEDAEDIWRRLNPRSPLVVEDTEPTSFLVRVKESTE